VLASMRVNRKPPPLATFLLTTLVLSAVFYALIIKAGSTSAAGGDYVAGLMWSPGIAAILTCKLHGRDLGALGWTWGRTRYQVMSYLIPLSYAATVYVIVWLTGLGGFYDEAFAGRIVKGLGLGPISPPIAITAYFLLLATTSILSAFALSLGEEIGWRGFLVPELHKAMGFTRAALVSGAIWAAWHYPTIILADYNAGTPVWYGLTCFTIMVVGFAFLFAWMRLRSGSLWTGVVLHTSHNIFIQQFFDRLTTDTGSTEYIVGEFGAGLAVAAVATGIYFWTRRGDVEHATDHETSPAGSAFITNTV
jgi:uncharacterized protein